MYEPLRDIKHEAVDGIRGFVGQFATTTISILQAKPGEQVFVEAFEDIQKLDLNDDIVLTQIKDETGFFSVTRKPVCEMLERWACAFRKAPNTTFAFITTQTAGNMFNRSSAFAKWTGGSRDDSVFQEIISGLSQY